MEIQFSPDRMETARTQPSPIAVKLRCDSLAIFGRPVVPEVWIIRAVSSGLPCCNSAGKRSGLLLIQYFPHLEQIPEGNEPRIIPIGTHSRRIDVDHVTDMAESAADGNHLIDLLLVLGKDERRPDPVQGCGQIIGDGRCEEVQCNSADSLRP